MEEPPSIGLNNVGMYNLLYNYVSRPKGQVVITKPRIGGSYTEYYISTISPKLKKPVNVKKIILQETAERLSLHDLQETESKSC